MHNHIDIRLKMWHMVLSFEIANKMYHLSMQEIDKKSNTPFIYAIISLKFNINIHKLGQPRL